MPVDNVVFYLKVTAVIQAVMIKKFYFCPGGENVLVFYQPKVGYLI